MPQVYLACTDVAEPPLTLVAQHLGEAFRICDLWRQRHAPHLVDEEVWLIALEASDLAKQPQLADATRSETTGLMWWSGEERGWVLGPADGDALGQISPPAPKVHCVAFTNCAGTDAVYVFATTALSAFRLLRKQGRDPRSIDPEGGKIVELSAWLLHGPFITLRDDMFAGRTGVGRLCDDGFWHILPVGYVVAEREAN